MKPHQLPAQSPLVVLNQTFGALPAAPIQRIQYEAWELAALRSFHRRVTRDRSKFTAEEVARAAMWFALMFPEVLHREFCQFAKYCEEEGIALNASVVADVIRTKTRHP